MQDFTAMAFFVHVAEQGSFTAAARHINEPLSTISRRIAELEQSLGVRLLERSTRKVRLTDLGESYYDFCRRGLQEFESATLAVEERQSDVAGLLRITVPPSLVDPYFLPAVTGFQMAYPNARIAIFSTERYVDLLHERVDMAFRISPLKDSQLMTRKIASYGSFLVAAPDYLAGPPPITTPDDLSAHRVIAFDAGTGPVTWRMRRTEPGGKVRNTSVDLLPHLMMNDFAAILQATLQGSGLARVPSILCATALGDGRLVAVLPEWTFETVTISAVMPGGRNMPRLMRLFLDHCVETLPQAIENAERAIKQV